MNPNRIFADGYKAPEDGALLSETCQFLTLTLNFSRFTVFIFCFSDEPKVKLCTIRVYNKRTASSWHWRYKVTKETFGTHRSQFRQSWQNMPGVMEQSDGETKFHYKQVEKT